MKDRVQCGRLRRWAGCIYENKYYERIAVGLFGLTLLILFMYVIWATVFTSHEYQEKRKLKAVFRDGKTLLLIQKGDKHGGKR